MFYINIHTHNPSGDPEIFEIQNLLHTQTDFIKKCPGHLFSLGVHPWHTKDIHLEKEIDKIKRYAYSKNVIAIGECGLDKLKGAVLEAQIDIFKAHALIAEELKKPLIIHCVRAYQEIISIHQKINPIVPWIIHDFNKNEKLADQLIKSGFILSFGKSLCDNKPYLLKLFSELPDDYYFFETDEETGVKLKLLYECAAKIKNISLEKLVEIIKHNFERCFKIKADDFIK